MSCLSLAPKTSSDQIAGCHTEKASIASSHNPYQASHYPDNSASVSIQGTTCLCITVPMNHISNFHGTDHNLLDNTTIHKTKI